ncbi:DUF3431 domain-containing protein [Siphonobacter sp. SORGH_AS_1065]|uniref:DUF3431 domain-containing protein n=1 Tax=Siphonobacter sp. SORGH_AS_1065 TaxID=3041795 RepID=UPI0027827F3E|nr:DUF3431 domain-containing protein [Siphonobacter sp. SORGH_AS_1065]MDQ1088775.1 hypothetical protein [Siphonobacter sp. SORGH_AS_1065]
MQFELVVAHYNENLNWLRKVPKLIQQTVYHKDSSQTYESGIRLPNVGREAHTYLHHILEKYDSLAEITVFCQGKPFDHAFDFHKTLRELAAGERQISGFQWLGHLIDTDDKAGEKLFKTWSKNEDARGLDIAGYYRALTGLEGPDKYTFVLGAQFIIHREIIQQKPKSYYQHALELSITFPDAAHCYERTWDKVFGVQGIPDEVLQGRETVHLKPMRHQTL